jgi:diphosphomevalonate decarboxylase
VRATATAHPNIALVKYWGKRDAKLNLPAVPSLSLTLDGFATTTTVTWGAERDDVVFNGAPADADTYRKVLGVLDLLDPGRPRVRVVSDNDFPSAAGLASSSSGFAALVVAAASAAGLPRTATELSVLARRARSTACRSLWGGFVEWRVGERPDGTDSHGVPVAPADHWDVVMVVAIVSGKKKAVGSTSGMEASRATSPYYDAWVRTAPGRVETGRAAVLARDLGAVGEQMEASTFEMHALMHTTRPPILYWQPATVACLHAVRTLRDGGLGAWATMDAGPNVKVLCVRSDADIVANALREHVEDVRIARPGGAPTVS